MNYLMHLFLAGDDPEAVSGNMMGDFVKGRLDERYSTGIRQGIVLHRRIDSFAAGNRWFIQSKRRVDKSFGLYKGVLVDLFYDHFLATNWEEYSAVPFPEFILKTYEVLARHAEAMPERLRELLPRMFSSNWLLSYEDLNGLESVLKRMSGRIHRPNPLGEGISELKREYRNLEEDFRRFMPEITAYVKSLERPGG
jgi:acyl carrier protein phosphodiesterase